MREILFRGKRKDNGEWVYGGILQTHNWSEISVVTDYYGSMYEPPSCEVDSYEVIPETAGQYTGLTDKNGKKIFEGDILKANNGHIGWVIFRNGGFVKCCYCHPKSFNIIFGDNETVVGNTYDNPELLRS